MLIDTSGFNIAQSFSAPQKTGAGHIGAPTEKTFLLEGITDIYEALPKNANRADKGGPIYPTIGSKLYPAFDALETTMDQLGKHPTPAEVDRSNIRRLIRAFQPIAEAFSSSYDSRDFKKSMKRIQNVASSLGQYKDVSVIHNRVASICPDGKVPFAVERKLDKLQKKREEEFQDAYKDFRKEDMPKALKVLRNPEHLDMSNPHRIEQADRKTLGSAIRDLIGEVQDTGLLHTEPEKFHDGRKIMRKLLNAVDASRDTFDFNDKTVQQMRDLVTVYGEAQDRNIAYEWLKDEGFDKLAATMKNQYNEYQQKALEAAEKFLNSGALETLQKSVS